VPDDDPVARDALLLQPEVDRPVPRERVELDERPLVEQAVDPLAGGLLAACVLLGLGGVFGCAGRGVDPLAQIGQLGGRAGCRGSQCVSHKGETSWTVDGSGKPAGCRGSFARLDHARMGAQRRRTEMMGAW